MRLVYPYGPVHAPACAPRLAGAGKPALAGPKTFRTGRKSIVLQKSDLVHGAELGLIVGGAAGLVMGAILVLVPLGGVQLQLVMVLIMALGGALFGLWVSSMVAASVPNTKLLGFAKDIEEGKYLMMVDVPFRRVEEIQSLLQTRHPEDKSGGVEPTVPAFP